MNNILIKCENLKYKYKKSDNKWILNGINLKIYPDDFILICGSSGSGKSTLCRTFNGLIPHFYGGMLEGNVYALGLPIAGQSIDKLFMNIGMVFQNKEAQLFTSSVEKEIAFGLESLGVEREEIKERISNAIKELNIAHLKDKNPRELSDGEQELVLIASMIALSPKLLILDEPFANLDPSNVSIVKNALKKVHEKGISIIVCEHRLHHLISDVTRIIIIKDGKILSDGSLKKVFEKNIIDESLSIPLPIQIGRRLEISPLPFNVKKLKEIKDEISEFKSEIRDSIKNVRKKYKILEFSNVSHKIWKRIILNDITFSLYRGECLALVGANGAGKTTLIKHINGLLKPLSGSIKLFNSDIKNKKVSQLAAHVGMAFQNPNDQFFKYNVRDEIVVGAKILKRYDEKWITRLTKLFDLEPLLERSPYRLSEGEKKRVSFASALSARPELIVLDEPTAGQDKHFKESLGELINSLIDEGKSILMVTHDLEFAEYCSHRWLVLSKGELLFDGAPNEVMSDEKIMKRSGLRATDRFELFHDNEKSIEILNA